MRSRRRRSDHGTAAGARFGRGLSRFARVYYLRATSAVIDLWLVVDADDDLAAGSSVRHRLEPLVGVVEREDTFDVDRQRTAFDLCDQPGESVTARAGHDHLACETGRGERPLGWSPGEGRDFSAW